MTPTIIRHIQVKDRCVTMMRIMHNGFRHYHVQTYDIHSSRLEERTDLIKSFDFENNFEAAYDCFDRVMHRLKVKAAA